MPESLPSISDFYSSVSSRRCDTLAGRLCTLYSQPHSRPRVRRNQTVAKPKIFRQTNEPLSVLYLTSLSSNHWAPSTLRLYRNPLLPPDPFPRAILFFHFYPTCFRRTSTSVAVARLLSFPFSLRVSLRPSRATPTFSGLLNSEPTSFLVSSPLRNFFDLPCTYILFPTIRHGGGIRSRKFLHDRRTIPAYIKSIKFQLPLITFFLLEK